MTSHPGIPNLRSAIPILRVADARASERFYSTYLGFTTDWEHQFEPGFPLMMSISCEGATLFLSEHAGTGTDRCEVYIYVNDVDALYNKASEAGLKTIKSPVAQPWGVRESEILDPDSHRITLGQKI